MWRTPCASAGALAWVKDVHRHVLEAGLESDLRVASGLVHSFAKSGSIDDARLVFDRMVEQDVFTWSVMVGGLADHGRGHEAYELFMQMQRGGCVPDTVIYVSILNACASAGTLEWVKDVNSHILEAGQDKDLFVGNALVHSHAMRGSGDDALRWIFLILDSTAGSCSQLSPKWAASIHQKSLSSATTSLTDKISPVRWSYGHQLFRSILADSVHDNEIYGAIAV